MQSESVCTSSIFGTMLNVVVNVALMHMSIGTSFVLSLLHLYLHLTGKQFLFPWQELSRCNSFTFFWHCLV